MKKGITLLYGLLNFICVALAQQNLDAEKRIVTYLNKLNYENLTDKTIYIESAIIDSQNPNDTLHMKRWFQHPNFSRVELFYQGNRTLGFCSNGKEYNRFDLAMKEWIPVNPDRYYDTVIGYDFRGPLYTWKERNLQFTKCEPMKWEDNDVYRITVIDPERADRFYIFEKNSGLLFFIMPITDETMQNKQRDVDWRSINEYTPIENYLFPSIESYQFNNSITIYYSKIKLLPFDEQLFNVSNTK